MSAGKASSSLSTVAFKVSTAQAMQESHGITFLLCWQTPGSARRYLPSDVPNALMTTASNQRYYRAVPEALGELRTYLESYWQDRLSRLKDEVELEARTERRDARELRHHPRD